MEIGIFSRTYQTKTAGESFRRIRADGIRHTQFNFSSCGLEPLPEEVPDEILAGIREAADRHGMILDALTGTFNMIDPDPEARREGIARFEKQCRRAHALGIPVVTLCTGSRNPRSKWEWDERNMEDSAWEDLRRTTDQLIRFARDYDVILGVEPEKSNVICSAARARRFLDETNDPHLKIIMDGANLIGPGEKDQMKSIMEEAFFLLGKDIVLAHAKDLADTPETGFTAPGQGCLDFAFYVDLLKKCGYDGPLIMHGLSPDQVHESRAFLEMLL